MQEVIVTEKRVGGGYCPVLEYHTESSKERAKMGYNDQIAKRKGGRS